MRIDQSALKTFTTEVTPECAEFISSLRKRDSVAEFASNLDKITEWYSTLGKIEMGRWAPILNDCDDILEMATREDGKKGMMIDYTDELDCAVISVLRFTSLLFENSFSRSVYSSVDHLFKLLDSNKMFVVVQTLRLLLVISKSSRYITQHVKNVDKRLLYMKLTANTESWTAKLRAHKMNEYCSKDAPAVDLSQVNFRTTSGLNKSYHIDFSMPFLESSATLKKMFQELGSEVEESEQILALTKLRIAYNFGTVNGRGHCIMAKLISISVLFYSRCLLDEWRINCLLHDDFIEQVCALIQLELPGDEVLLDAIKTEAMKTLASIVFLEKPRKIQLVVDCLGLNSYHGFTSSLVRTCVDKLKAGAIESNTEYTIPFVTALFSLIYHIAGFDYGGESLITCSMIGSLLVVVKTYSLSNSQISFVTRAVRIIDILTGIDVSEFNANDGMNVIVNRFVHEVKICQDHLSSTDSQPTVCHQQRIALMKSLLNFLKRAIADANYTAQIRRIMEAELPLSIKYIIENPDYFGPSLLHCAIQLTTSFIYQEPAQLTSLQDSGLTTALLNSLFNEKFPVSRDIVTGLPNICSALCLNERGLADFNNQKPLERIFRIIFSTKFITSVRKRKTEILEAANALGTAFDELMRHQPTLRKDLLTAFATILDDILAIGNMETQKCVIAWTIGKTSSPDDEFLRNSEACTSASLESTVPGNEATAIPTIFHHSPSEGSLGQCDSSAANAKKTSTTITHQPFRLCHEQDGVVTLPFGDYLGMIGAMVEAILTNRAAHENSAMMLECGIPQRLVSLLALERPYPALLQSPFLHNLAVIIRHLLSQTNKIDAFDALMQCIHAQLKRYKRVENLDDFNNNRMFLVNRINALAFVACNFLKTSFNNVHDTRALLLKYFGTTGLEIIPECFDSFRRLYSDIIFLNIQPPSAEQGGVVAGVAEHFSPSSRVSSITPAPLLSEEISIADPPVLSAPKEPTVAQSAKSKTIDLIHASIHRLQKQLSDIVTHLSKIFCSTVTRPRRGFDKSLFVHANDASTKLFQGMARVMEYDELLFQSKNWSCMYICHVISILKKLLFDDYQGPSIMLPFFYSTGCHQAFFSLGQFIVDNEAEMLSVLTTAWLSIIQRLVNVNNINTGKTKDEPPRLNVEGFDPKKYLSVCHQDSLMSLQKFFKSAVDPAKDKDKARDLIEKVLGTIQVLIRGIIQLNESEKKDEKMPGLDALLNEIDPEKVQCLVEMGFSQSDAVDALLIHTSVSDATDYLIGLASTSSNAATTSDTTSAPQRPTTAATNLSECLDYIFANIVPDCVTIVERDPTLVYSVSELFSVFMNEQMASDWISNTFVVKIIKDQQKLQETMSGSNVDSEVLKQQATSFAAVLHLFCLMSQTIEHMKMASLLNDEFISNIAQMLFMMDETKYEWVNSLISPIMLCLDMYDRKRRSDIRQKFFNDNVEHVQWCYFVSDRYTPSQEWRDYPPVCSAKLNKTFREGRQSTRITIAEKNYVVDFIDMVQRPVDNSNTGGNGLSPGPVYARAKLKSTFNMEEFFKISSGEESADANPIFSEKMVHCLLQMLKKGNEASQPLGITYSILSLLLRLLSVKGMISEFVKEDGIHIILRLLCSERRRLLSTISTLILRTCLNDDDATMANSFANIIRGVESGAVTSLSDISSRTLFAKTKKSQREWRRISRFLLPLAACSPSIYYDTMRKLVKLHNNEVILTSTEDGNNEQDKNKEKQDILRVAMCGSQSLLTLEKLVSAIIDELFETNNLPANNKERVFGASSLLRLLAELLRSYAQTASLIIDATCGERSAISLIIDLHIVKAIDSADAVSAAKAVLVNLLNVGGSITSKASEIIINDTKTLLCSLLSNAEAQPSEKTENEAQQPVGEQQISAVNETTNAAEGTNTSETKGASKLSDGVIALASLIILLRDYAQENGNKNRDIKQTYSLIRHIHKKNLVVDFAKAIWYLPLRGKQNADAVDTILHLFECVAQDLIAINSVRSANATAATASATAAAIAAATQAAAQVQARSADTTDAPATADVTTASATNATTAQNHPETTDADYSTVSQMDETTATAPFPIDTEMSDLNVSQVLANIARANDTTDGAESDSNDEISQDDRMHNEEESSDDSVDSSEGSDGEGNNTLNDDDEAGNGVYQHRNLTHELGMVRTSTPISEDDLDHHEEEDEMDAIHNDRVIIGDEDAAPRDDDDDEDDDEDGMDDDPMDDDEGDEEAIEFDDVLNDILDVSLMPGDGAHGAGINFNTITGGTGTDTTANVRVLVGNEFFPGNMSNGLVEFNTNVGLADLEMHMANILSGRLAERATNGTAFSMTIPISHNIERGGGSGFNITSLFGAEALETNEADNNYHPLLHRPEVTSSRSNPPANAPTNQPNPAYVSNVPEQQYLFQNPLSVVNNPRMQQPHNMEAFFREFHNETMQRLMMNRVFFNARRLPQPGLRRQNALRRWHPIAAGGAAFGNLQPGRGSRFMRLFDESVLNDGYYRPQSFEQSAERRLIQLLVPFFLDRVFEQMKLLDGHAMHYVSLIIASCLEQELVVKEEEKPAKQLEPATTENTQQQSIPDAPGDEQILHEDNELATGTAEHLQITTNDVNTLVESSDDTRESEMSGIQLTENVNIPSESIVQPLEEPRAENVADDEREVMEVDAAPNAQEEQPSTSNANEPDTVDEFREILGDIEIPEGIDPAFLAALPEEMRQEVIRDHMVQQRAQRINSARRNGGATAASGNGEEEAVLDQSFLAALVPELQEEILAQHEQMLAQRNREQAAAAAAANPPAAANTNAEGANQEASNPVDVEAIFESLPPGLRAQVLADADDSVLQILPPNLLAEANRLRANLEQQQVFRFARIVDRRRHPGRPGVPAGDRHHHYTPMGQQAAITAGSIEQKNAQMFDKESLTTILLLYFMDQEKHYLTRLQKVLKLVCLHSGTCDQVVWNILSILNVLNNECEDDTSAAAIGSWLDSFYTQTALNQTEKALFMGFNGVNVHPLVRSTVCLRLLDTLILLAKAFPQHFLPNKLRHVSNSGKRFDTVPDLNNFWNVVQETNRKAKESFKPSVKALAQCREIIPPSLEKSPLAFLLEFADTELIKNNSNLMDKCLRILQIVAQSIPSDSQAKINESSSKWLTERLQNLADTVLLSSCDEGLKDGRLFFIEIIRILPTLRAPIFEMLYSIVRKQGEHLQIDINALLAELEEFKETNKVELANKASSEKPAEGRPTTSTALLGTGGSARDLNSMDVATPSEVDLRLHTLKDFTKRNSQPKKFLKALETISYLRNQLKNMIERRKRVDAQAQPGQSVTAAAPAAPLAQPATEESTAQGTSNRQAPTTEAESAASSSGAAVPKKKHDNSAALSILEDTTAEDRYLAEMLDSLEPLWSSLSNCLEEMSRMLDSHAVFSLQEAAEAFFLAHAFAFNQKELENQQKDAHSIHGNLSQGSNSSSANVGGVHFRIEDTNKYTQRMFHFAEKHRYVLNQILRSNNNNLMEDSAFAILTYFPKLLDFDVKRKYFYKEIRKLDDRSRHDDVAVRIRRNHLFGDSFRELIRLKPADWKARFYIIFEGEEGQDAGGLLREWYSIITREVFNPNYALFITAPGDRVTYMINKSSYINPEHLDYFKFIGRVIAKAIYDNKQLDCYFTRAFYKHILNVPVRYQDIGSEDPDFLNSIEFLLNNPVAELGVDWTFSVSVDEFGEMSLRKLKENGDNIQVTDANKEEYVQLVCQMKMTGSIRSQLDAFLEGFYQIIPKKLISIFNEQELELLLSGLPEIDVDDLYNNTEYKGYNRSSPQIQWFWRTLRSLEQEDLAKFLQFVTGTSKVPLQGFSQLQGMNGVQKFTIHLDSRSNDRLPSAHTCFNQLDLPKYDSYEQLREMILLAIRECSEGFAFA